MIKNIKEKSKIFLTLLILNLINYNYYCRSFTIFLAFALNRWSIMTNVRFVDHAQNINLSEFVIRNKSTKVEFKTSEQARVKTLGSRMYVASLSKTNFKS